MLRTVVLLPRLASICLSIASAFAGLFLLFHYPLQQGFIAYAAFLVAALIAAYRPSVSYFLVPALLPIIGLAPWTGWITFEEFDLLMLALIAGAYFRLGLSDVRKEGLGYRYLYPFGASLLMIAMSCSMLISLFRGVSDSGGFIFGWFQGYYESMNSVRLAKPFFFALLLLPLGFSRQSQDSLNISSLFSMGMTVGLGLVSLTIIWERGAFPGLLDFSSDYRTTALFWEMHVGGAALDGFLALAIPFALHQLMVAESRWRVLFVSTVLLLATYACLTTFSRALYAAVPISLALIVWLSKSGLHLTERSFPERKTMLFGVGVLTFFALAASWTFRTSGYRGMLALLLAVGLFYPTGLAFMRTTKFSRWSALVTGLTFAVIGTLAAIYLPKGAYLVFALATLLTIAGLWLAHHHASPTAWTLSIVGYLSMLSGCVLISWHWGGEEAAYRMAISCIALLFGFLAFKRWPLPVFSLEMQISLGGTLFVIAAVVAIFSGGRYMADRFATTNQDFEYRLRHWEAGLAQLQGADWLLGKGLGRVPTTYFFSAPRAEYPGGFRLQMDDGQDNRYLRLVGGRHINGWGEIFRITQRISPGQGSYRVRFDVRAENDIALVFEVCAKHLLYPGNCVARQVDVRGKPDRWQEMEVDLLGDAPSGGAWYAPQLVGFSIAMVSRGGVADLDNLVLVNEGNSLLKNGDFSSELARWFSSSDKYHLPWHMKNIFLHVLFEQGWFGFITLLAMLSVALFRMIWGRATDYPLAAATASGLVGFLIVGISDSLLDVPRVATLFYMLLLFGLVAKTSEPDLQSGYSFRADNEPRPKNKKVHEEWSK